MTTRDWKPFAGFAILGLLVMAALIIYTLSGPASSPPAAPLRATSPTASAPLVVLTPAPAPVESTSIETPTYGRTLSIEEMITAQMACSSLETRGDVAGYRNCMSEQQKLVQRSTAIPAMVRLTVGEQITIKMACAGFQTQGDIAGYQFCMRTNFARASASPALPPVVDHEDNPALDVACSRQQVAGDILGYQACVRHNISAASAIPPSTP